MFNTLSISSNFVLVDFRIRLEIRPKMNVLFIDEVMNIPYVNTFVLYASIENVEFVAVFPNFFANTEKYFLCGSCFFCHSILVLKLQVSLNSWSQNVISHHFLIGFVSLVPSLLLALR